MRLLVTCNSVEEAKMLASHLKSKGISAEISGEALANMPMHLYPKYISVFVSESNVSRAHSIIEQDFPEYHSAGIRPCRSCAEAINESSDSFRRPSFLFAIWIRMQATFRFKSFCPRCRRFYR